MVNCKLAATFLVGLELVRLKRVGLRDLLATSYVVGAGFLC